MGGRIGLSVVMLRNLAICLCLVTMCCGIGLSAGGEWSNHFTITARGQSSSLVDEVGQLLERNRKRILDDLGVDLPGKVEVVIYSDLKSFHKAIGYADGPDWLIGIARPMRIEMVSPSNPGPFHTRASVMQGLVHEFAHVVIFAVAGYPPRIPIWLNEGVASFMAGQDFGMKEGMKSRLASNVRLPYLAEIDAKFYDGSGYQLAISLVRYIVDIYGKDKLTRLIRPPFYPEKVLGVSEWELWGGWSKWAKDIYGGGR